MSPYSLKKFYLGAVRDFVKQMRIGDGGANEVEGQSDVFLDDFILRPLNFSRNPANRHSCESRNPVLSKSYGFPLSRE